MAFSKEEHENLLKEIAMTGGDTDNMLKLLQKLRDDFDDREGELRRYHETSDSTQPSTAEERKAIEEESRRDDAEDKGMRRDPVSSQLAASHLAMDSVPYSQYEDLRNKYISRFFGTPAEAIESQEADVKDDGKRGKMSFDDLFKRREGMM